MPSISRARPRMSRRRAVSIAAAFGLLAAWVAIPGAEAATTTSPTAQAAETQPTTIHGGPNFVHLPAPLSTSDCQATYGIRCYSPAQLHAAYNLDPLYDRGIDGSGVTIVIAVPFGSPTIRHDLEVFDRRFGLPDPDLRIVRFGDIPPYDPQDPARLEWAAGTTLQVEYAHAIAPGADIVIAETAVDETVGMTGFPELMQAEESLINAGVGDVIVQIEGARENTFPGFDQGDHSGLLSLRETYRNAAAHHVTVLAAAGERGGNAAGTGTVRWPSSDPLVTSVGAHQMYLDDAGRVLRPNTTWNDGYGGAGAGGVSAVFARPPYQSGVGDAVGRHRGTPDITMSGSVDGGCWVYASFGGTGGIGWDIFDGTVESVALFSGIVALADQVAGHRLGFINPGLYRLGTLSRHGHRATGLVDITEGNNSLGGVTGFDAGPGYDLATGWGTIDAAAFVPALARMG
jgi:subtilase family serine protease